MRLPESASVRLALSIGSVNSLKRIAHFCSAPGLAQQGDGNPATHQGNLSETTLSQEDGRTALDISSRMGYSYIDTRGASSHALEEWKKINRLVSNLPSPTIIQELRGVFFTEADWYFNAIDQPFFDRAHRVWLQTWDTDPAATEQVVTAETLCFPAILFQILALAAQFVPPGSVTEETLRRSNSPSLNELSRHLSDTGEMLLNTIGRHLQATTAVEADLMRCAWLKNGGRGSESWYSLGSAVRQAQDQRLHLEPSPKPTKNQREDLEQSWSHEHRRRLWATLFTWESHMALQLGRPRMINAADCSVKPSIDSDIPDHPSLTLFASPAPDERPSLYTAAVVKHYLAQHIHKLMSMGAFQPSFEEHSTIQSVHAEVVHFLGSLPPAMRPEHPDTGWDLQCPDIVMQRLQISIVAESFLLALHKPYAAQQPHSQILATSAAINVLNATQLLFERTKPHQYKIYTLVFYTIDAGLLLSALLVKCPSVVEQFKEAAVRSLRQAFARLGVMKESVSAAVAGERALTQCLGRFSQQPEHVQDGNTDTDTIPATTDQSEVTGRKGTDDRRSKEQLPTSAFPQAQPISNLDEWMGNGSDLFTQIMDDEAWTASWLEQMVSVSSMDFELDEDMFDWNSELRSAVDA